MAALKVLVENAQRMMISAAEQDAGIAIEFADGATSIIPLEGLPELRNGLRTLQLPNPYQLVLATNDGEELDVGWDFVRHYCDESLRRRDQQAATEGQRALGDRIRRLRTTHGL